MELTLSLNQTQVAEYCCKNGYAQMMFGSSADDYISSRCLISNNLTTGFSLYAQAIEKFLKALIFLESGQEPQLARFNWHNPYKLKLQLQKHKDYGLDRFDELLQRLLGHFQTRYFDNADQSNKMSGDELDEFDGLWMHLFDLAPFPPEVKYRLWFPHIILDRRTVEYWPSFRHWATVNNKFLTTEKINQMEEIYLAVTQHLHGERIQTG
jgi:hypothetical protein